VRERPGGSLDIGGERRVEGGMVGGMIADDVDDRGPCLARIVQVGRGIAEAGRQMQQRAGGLAGHPAVSVGRPRHHALEQRQHAAHPAGMVERRDEMHLRGARIGETDLDAAGGQGLDEAFRTIHAGRSAGWASRSEAEPESSGAAAVGHPGLRVPLPRAKQGP